jgi:hypothetical protein
MLSIDTIAQDSRHLIAAKLNDEITHSSRAILSATPSCDPQSGKTCSFAGLTFHGATNILKGYIAEMINA